jgi:arsenite oxidase large subunit
MAYKRNIDRLPIPPKDAKVHNVVCHYCIVGCGYHALSWPVDRQGGMQPGQNAFNADLTKQQGAMSPAWFSPSMYNIVKQNGRDVHLVVKPDFDCVVNSGLGSTRGARIAELSYSAVTGTLAARLTEPQVWRYGVLTPTSWDDAVTLVAEVTRRVVETQGEDGLIVSAYDHGGAGGGYENTWATGKLYFGSMKIKNIRIHNRPAYNSEVHGTRDMGVGELNNCYEDAELADTIVAVGTNALETQTNYFLNHWIPNLRGTSANKKKAEFGDEPTARARIIFVDPRRTPTIAACEAEAGSENVLHLAINSGTDLALFNALGLEEASKTPLFRATVPERPCKSPALPGSQSARPQSPSRRRRALMRAYRQAMASQLTEKPMSRIDAFRMVRRRAAAIGMDVKIGCHTFRATGITAYLENGGSLENAQLMAAHESPRTTKLYDRTGDEIPLEEVERIKI